jgi:PEGA domain
MRMGEKCRSLFSYRYALQLCVTRLSTQPCAKHRGCGGQKFSGSKQTTYKRSLFHPVLSVVAAILLLIPAAPLLAQHVDDPGELQILTSHETEKDSGVWVDGEYIGYLRDFWGNKKIMLAPGDHEISIRKFGYQDFTGKVRIDAGQIQLLPIMMELDVSTQYPTQNTAALKINVNPPEAAVLIDGAYVGYADQISGIFKSLPVTAGRRKVRIEMQGYRPYETEVGLTAGQSYEIRAALTKGGPELDGLPRVVQATIRDGATSLQLSPGRLYVYGMAVGGQGRSTLFSLGQYASVFHEGGTPGAAVAYGDNELNTYTTQTDRHILGGASIGGAWQTMRAFYGSNAAPGASDATADFTVEQNSFVVFIGLASSQQQIALEGVPGLELDSFHGGAAAAASMVIAHAELPPGSYTVVERSSALAQDAPRGAMADLLAVFVFAHH